MNWAIIIGPLLKAKLALVVLLGQLFVYHLIYVNVDIHEERLVEVALASLILWIGYIGVFITQALDFGVKWREQEQEWDDKFEVETLRHEEAEQKLIDQIAKLESKTPNSE